MRSIGPVQNSGSSRNGLRERERASSEFSRISHSSRLTSPSSNNSNTITTSNGPSGQSSIEQSVGSESSIEGSRMKSKSNYSLHHSLLNPSISQPQNSTLFDVSTLAGNIQNKYEEAAWKISSTSNVIKDPEDAKFIIDNLKFKIEDCKLIHRASQHKFRIKKYFESHGNEKDILFLCQTTKGKIIGAFSPASHYYTGKQKKVQVYGEWALDERGQSFIFSVTDKKIFTLDRSDRAVWRRNDNTWINFGEDEFRIGDLSNLRNNLAVMNYHYKCSQYDTKTVKGLINSCESFIGSREPFFRTEEWQAWKIVRESKHQKINLEISQDTESGSGSSNKENQSIR